MPVKKTIKKATKKTLSKKKIVKKVPAKKTVKKVAKKTTKKVTSGSKKKPLMYADSETSFWVTNGEILDSLVSLKDALDQMDKEVYEYHAGGAQNDFANWVALVLIDDKCASDLKKAKTPRSAKTTIVRHLKYYSI